MLFNSKLIVMIRKEVAFGDGKVKTAFSTLGK
jgi:hypothetical protein